MHFHLRGSEVARREQHGPTQNLRRPQSIWPPSPSHQVDLAPPPPWIGLPPRIWPRRRGFGPLSTVPGGAAPPSLLVVRGSGLSLPASGASTTRGDRGGGNRGGERERMASPWRSQYMASGEEDLSSVKHGR
jgi:hypothetical protein